MRHSRLSAAVAWAPLAAAIDVNVAAQKPSDAVEVPADFVSFGIESAFLNDFADDFSGNLVESIASRMGAPLILRVGGTSGDNFVLDPTFDGTVECIPPEGKASCPDEPGSSADFRVGSAYYQGFNAFPGAKMTIQAPLSNPANTSRAAAFVQKAYKVLGPDRCAGIAVGNEPEFYNSSSTSLDQYVAAAVDAEKAIIDALSLSGDATKIFEGSNAASGAKDNADLFKTEDTLETELGTNGNLLSMAEHYYQFTGDATDDATKQKWMNPKEISARLQNKYQPTIDAVKANGLQYVISEDAATLKSVEAEFGGGFAFALWAVDFNLAAMARGVDRVANIAGRPYSNRLFWVPHSTQADNVPEPQARAPFAAAALVADFIGKDTQAAVVQVPLDQDFVSAYAAYDAAADSARALRVALVNNKLWTGSGDDQRPSASFKVPAAGATRVRVRSLHAEMGAAAMGFDYCHVTDGCTGNHNVTWAGEQWSYTVDQGHGHGDTVEETLQPDDSGFVTVSVPDSEAAILFFE